MEKGTCCAKLAPPIQHIELALLGVPVVAVLDAALKVGAGLLCMKLPAIGTKLAVSILMEFTKKVLQLPFSFSDSF